MNFTWSPQETPPEITITGWGWARAVLRGLPLLLVLLSGVVLMALMRLIERPLHGLARPWTPVITVVVCRISLRILGLRHRVEGQVMAQNGAFVANHSSWLDIFALNAATRLYFVSKSEVAGWPGIGLLAKITGTVFIARDRTQARLQQKMFETRLTAGHRLLFFPEGTSTDNFRVLPFKSTLFQAFFEDGLRQTLYIQPLSVVYTAPSGQDARFYGWWGDMEFGPHALALLATPGGGQVKVVCHAPIPVRDMADRKALAARSERAVRSGMPQARQSDH
ncbi:MAG: lysophospholipid acyltransferase family protein [Pseudomonadota bacterium]